MNYGFSSYLFTDSDISTKFQMILIQKSYYVVLTLKSKMQNRMYIEAQFLKKYSYPKKNLKYFVIFLTFLQWICMSFIIEKKFYVWKY